MTKCKCEHWQVCEICRPDLHRKAGDPVNNPVSHPKHYTQHPSGVECVQMTEHMGFCLGNAVKYIWRADLKNDALEDLKKARWYIDREIERRTRSASTISPATLTSPRGSLGEEV